MAAARYFALAILISSLIPFSDGIATGEVFDHDAQNCHDVSVWGPVSYKQSSCQKCQTSFEPECNTRREVVCEEVPETTCELVAFTDCKFFTDTVQIKETVVVTDGVYVPWECNEVKQIETHTKLVPRCVNVTRQDCVTKWRITPGGRKVWDGNEQCRPVTWMNCTLTEVQKPFEQTYTKCAKTGVPIPTMKCELRDKPRMVTGQRCEVKSAVNCKCTNKEQCVEITFTECKETAKPISCVEEGMRIPFQPKEHRVKCLLKNRSESPKLDPERSANRADLQLEQSFGAASRK